MRKKEKDAAAEIVAKLAEQYVQLQDVRDQMSKLVGSTVPGNTQNKGGGRVILVSRRLPIQLHPTEHAKFVLETDVTDQTIINLSAMHEAYRGVWVGTLGVEVETGWQRELQDQLKDSRMVPIFLDAERHALFYGGFCHTILWSLLHSALPTTDDLIAINDVESVEQHRGEIDMWQAYKAVNQHFADTIQSIYKEGDLICIQDYPLMLLPQMLRSLLPQSKISFVMHQPWPSSEIYRVLSQRVELLEGIMGADLIEFQTYNFARHFMTTVELLLDAATSIQGVEYMGHYASIAITPVGINPEKWRTMAKSPEVAAFRNRWAKQFEGRTLLLGVDGLDATKGLIQKLLAVEELFDMDPSLLERVSFVQVCLTSDDQSAGGNNRSDGDQQVLIGQIHRLMGRINSKWANIEDQRPLKFFTDFKPQELCALYTLSDVLLATPISDGMNIRPFEYVVSRDAFGLTASVVLSEYAGCARSLGGALLVNPWSTTEVAEAVLGAMHMEEDEAHRRHSNMHSYASNFTSQCWATQSIEQLGEMGDGNTLSNATHPLHKDHVVQAFNHSSRRLMVLSLEGVLAKTVALPELVTVPQDLLHSLRILSDDPNQVVVVRTPRSRETLERCLGDTNCVLVAEHGAYMKWGRAGRWESLLPDLDTGRLEDLVPVLQYFHERTPGSVIEHRDASLAWNYRDCDLGYGAWQAKQLHLTLSKAARTLPISVTSGDKVLEVFPHQLLLHANRFLQFIMQRVRMMPPPQRSRATSICTLGTPPLTSPRSSTTASNVQAYNQNMAASTIQAYNQNMAAAAGGRPPLVPPHDEKIPKITIPAGTTSLSASISVPPSPSLTPALSIKTTHSVPNLYQLPMSAAAFHTEVSGAGFSEFSMTVVREVDFLVVIASGQDVCDEAMFEAMAPSHYDFDKFVKQVGLTSPDLKDVHITQAEEQAMNGAPSPPDNNAPTASFFPGALAGLAPRSPLGHTLGLDNKWDIYSVEPPTRDQQTITSMLQGPFGTSPTNVAVTTDVGGRLSTMSPPLPVPMSGKNNDLFLLLEGVNEMAGTELRGSTFAAQRAVAKQAYKGSPKPKPLLSAVSSESINSRQGLAKYARGMGGSTNSALSQNLSGNYLGNIPQNLSGNFPGDLSEASQASSVIAGLSSLAMNVLRRSGSEPVGLDKGPPGTGFGRGGLVADKSIARQQIIDKSHFRPRKEYPPPGVLFRAMRAKYGESHIHHRIPETPAACWSLILATLQQQQGGAPAALTSIQLEEEDGFMAVSGRRATSGDRRLNTSGRLQDKAAELAAYRAKFEELRKAADALSPDRRRIESLPTNTISPTTQGGSNTGGATTVNESGTTNQSGNAGVNRQEPPPRESLPSRVERFKLEESIREAKKAFKVQTDIEEDDRQRSFSAATAQSQPMEGGRMEGGRHDMPGIQDYAVSSASVLNPSNRPQSSSPLTLASHIIRTDKDMQRTQTPPLRRFVLSRATSSDSASMGRKSPPPENFLPPKGFSAESLPRPKSSSPENGIAPKSSSAENILHPNGSPKNVLPPKSSSAENILHHKDSVPEIVLRPKESSPKNVLPPKGSSPKNIIQPKGALAPAGIIQHQFSDGSMTFSTSTENSGPNLSRIDSEETTDYAIPLQQETTPLGANIFDSNAPGSRLSTMELPTNTFSCTVGRRLSQAFYFIRNRHAVASLIDELSNLVPNSGH